MDSEDWNDIERARAAALIGLSFAPSSGNSTFAGGKSLAPSGGRRRLMLGTGIGIVIFFVTGSSMVSTTIFLDNPSRLKLSDSTFVCASIFTFNAGCGTGILMSGPQ